MQITQGRLAFSSTFPQAICYKNVECLREQFTRDCKFIYFRTGDDKFNFEVFISPHSVWDYIQLAGAERSFVVTREHSFAHLLTREPFRWFRDKQVSQHEFDCVWAQIRMIFLLRWHRLHNFVSERGSNWRFLLLLLWWKIIRSWKLLCIESRKVISRFRHKHTAYVVVSIFSTFRFIPLDTFCTTFSCWMKTSFILSWIFHAFVLCTGNKLVMKNWQRYWHVLAVY